MAVSNSSINQYSSLTQDSDAVEEMYCEHCEKLLDKYVPAEGLCVNCVEYMCGTCLRYHKLYMVSHTLQDKNGMPQDFCLEKCDVHKNQITKFFCGNCQKTACSECKVNEHKYCSNVKHLPSLVPGVEKSKELTDLFESIEHLSKELDTAEIRIDSSIHHISAEETQALLTINKHKEEVIAAYKKHQQDIIDAFDKKMEETTAKLKKERENLLQHVAEKKKIFDKKFKHSENETFKKVQTSKNSDDAKLQTLKDTNLKLKLDLNSVSTEIAFQKNLGQRCKIFVAMKKAEQDVTKLKLDANKVNENLDAYCDSGRYIVAPDTNVSDAITPENNNVFFQFKEIPSSRRKRTAKYKFDLNIKLISLSSLCLLSDNILLMTDYTGMSLLIYKDLNVNTKKYDIIKLTNKPWVITKVEDNKAAVTFPKEGIVRLITFTESMTMISTDDITVGAECYGIAYNNKNLIVSYETIPAKVQILDMSGNVLKCFDKDCNGQPLFSLPRYLTHSPDNTTIYVSDYNRNTVTSMTLDGKVNAIYRDDQLSRPYQMTVDESGTVYVCGSVLHNVHQLSSDLTNVKILLDKRQEMDRPVSVTYCQKNNRLYVGMLINNIIKVFDISLQ